MNTLRALIIGFLTLIAPCEIFAKLVTEKIDYTDASGTLLQGFAVYDDTWKEPRPGVLVIHDWRGLSDYSQHRAEMLAGLGYVAFTADIYGKDVRPPRSSNGKSKPANTRATALSSASAPAPPTTR